MMPDPQKRARERHTDRAAEAVARAAAEFISRTAGSESLITVTRALLTRKNERMSVFISVLPEEKAHAALAFLERQREAFSDYLKQAARLGPLPRIDFQLENGEGYAAPPGPLPESAAR